MSEQRNTILDSLREKADYLRLQMNLGTAEAREEFEKQKRDLSRWAKETAARMEDFSGEKALDLKRELEHLRVQAALAKAESKEALQEQEEKINRTLENAKRKAADFAAHAGAEAEEMATAAEHKLDLWQTKLDLLKLQAYLGSKEAGDAWEERKEKLRENLAEIELRIDRAKEDSSANFDHFKKEMTDAWLHFKSAFKRS